MNKYNALNYTLGDVDNSGAVNAIDASLVLDYYSRVSTGKSESLDDTQKKAADADKDGSINAVDASLILSYYVYTSTDNSADSNCDEQMDMADVVFIMQALANPNKYQLSEQGSFNADLDGNGITVGDAQVIQEKLLGIE